MRRLYRAPSHQVQSLGKDPDVVVVINTAISAKHALGLDPGAETGSANDDHHLIVRAASRSPLLM